MYKANCGECGMHFHSETMGGLNTILDLHYNAHHQRKLNEVVFQAKQALYSSLFSTDFVEGPIPGSAFKKTSKIPRSG